MPGLMRAREITGLTPCSPTAHQVMRNCVMNAFAAPGPTFMPMTWPWPSGLTATATLTMAPASRALPSVASIHRDGQSPSGRRLAGG